jgi:hypothetical protein
MIVFEILGWILILAVLHFNYHVLYAMFIIKPLDDYLGYSNESEKHYIKRLEGISYISERIYRKYWDRLPFLVNFALIVLNVSYIALLIIASVVNFTHINLNVFIFTILGIIVVCSIYINFMSVRIDEKEK